MMREDMITYQALSTARETALTDGSGCFFIKIPGDFTAHWILGDNAQFFSFGYEPAPVRPQRPQLVRVTGKPASVGWKLHIAVSDQDKHGDSFRLAWDIVKNIVMRFHIPFSKIVVPGVRMYETNQHGKQITIPMSLAPLNWIEIVRAIEIELAEQHIIPDNLAEGDSRIPGSVYTTYRYDGGLQGEYVQAGGVGTLNPLDGFSLDRATMDIPMPTQIEIVQRPAEIQIVAATVHQELPVLEEEISIAQGQQRRNFFERMHGFFPRSEDRGVAERVRHTCSIL